MDDDRERDGGEHPYRFHDELEAALIENIRSIRPIPEVNAAAGEAQGWLVPETLAALDEVDGIWRLAVPRRVDGLGVSARSILRISAEVAKGDPAAAWVVQIIGGSTWAATLASDQIQDELFAGGVPRMCAVFGPPVIATPVSGGYRVSGWRPAACGPWRSTTAQVRRRSLVMHA